MEPSFITQSNLDLFSEMMKNHGSFVVNKIPKSERVLFAAAVDAIIDNARTSIDFDHLIRGFEVFKDEQLEERMFLLRLFSNPVPTKRLAFDLADDIIKSIQVRFIDGGSKVFIGMYDKAFREAYDKEVLNG